MSKPTPQFSPEDNPLELDELLKQSASTGNFPVNENETLPEFSINSLEVETASIRHKREAGRRKKASVKNRSWFIKVILINVVSLASMLVIYWAFFVESAPPKTANKRRVVKRRRHQSNPSLPAVVAYPKDDDTSDDSNNDTLKTLLGKEPDESHSSVQQATNQDQPKQPLVDNPAKIPPASSSSSQKTDALSALDAGLFSGLKVVPITARKQFSIGTSSQNLAFSKSGKHLVSQDFDGTIQLWDVNSKKILIKIPGKQKDEAAPSFTGIALSNNAKQILIGSSDGSIRLVSTSKPKKTISLTGHRNPITAMRFFSEKKRAVTVDSAGIVYLWNIATGKSLGKIETSFRISQLAISSDEKWLVTGHWNGELALYELDKISDKPSLLPTREWTGHPKPVNGLAMSEDGNRVVSWAYESSLGEVVRVWNTKTGETISSFEIALPARGLLQVSKNGTELLSTDSYGTIQAWDIKGGQVTHQFQSSDTPLKKQLAHLFVSKNGSEILSVEESGVVRAWRISSSKNEKLPQTGVK